MSERQRLDEALVERQLAPNRSRARALVLAGLVHVDGEPAAKAGMRVATDARLEVTETPPYVSRGGEKLAAALAATSIPVEGRVCVDVGASTGGFTDCLLQRGAEVVIAVDVGYGQFDWRLRNDPRVVLLERTNARHLRSSDLPPEARAPDLLVIDVSFIGVAKVLPASGAVCADRCDALVLVKPQFECGPERVGRGGVVRRARWRRHAVASVAAAAEAQGWGVVGAVPSPIRGAAGNWECFLHLVRPPPAGADGTAVVAALEVPDNRVPHGARPQGNGPDDVGPRGENGESPAGKVE